MADEFKFSEKLSNVTENKASILKNLEDKSVIPSDSVSPDNNKGDSVVTEYQKKKKLPSKLLPFHNRI